jgi:FkbM family methyltransferase
MQNPITDSITIAPARNSWHLPGILKHSLEKTKLRYRAEKYRYKEDRGGISYILDTVTEHTVVFDIGAHKAGYLYYFLSRLGNTGKVYAFEPQSVLYHYLHKLKQLFNWDNVTVESFAVSDQPGTAMLSIPYNHGKPTSPCATIIESNMVFRIQHSELVSTIPIDEYCRIYNIVPKFLKVDVEGNEFRVFKGAERILQTCKPRILFECETRFVGEERMLETFAFLKQTGYTGYFIEGMSIRPIEKFDPGKHQDLSGRSYCNNFIFE